MDFNDKLAKVCGVNIRTVKRWNVNNNFPEYAKVIRKHLWNGNILYENWTDYRFNGKYITNIFNGQYTSIDEIESLWILKQQLQYKYELLTKDNNLDFKLILEKVL